MNKFIVKQAEWDQQIINIDNPYRQVCRPIDNIEFSELINDITIKFNIAKKQNSILDAGCGNGLVLSHLKEHFRQIYGIDYSLNMVRAAQKLIPNGIFIQAEASNFKFDDNQFDRVLAYSIFHYFASSEYALKSIHEMIRVCKKGGIVLIGDILDHTFEKTIKTSSDLEYEKQIPLIERYSEWRFYDLIKLRQILKDQGYRAEILTQPQSFKCNDYRKDFRIWV